MKAFDALATALVAEGVDTTFGMLGGGTEEVVDAVTRRGIRFVAVRHEQAAVGMADGYSRAGDRLGVAILSHGPGVANAATPLVVARKARARVLVICSDLGVEERFTPHGFEQELFLRATIGAYVTVKSARVLHLDLRRALGALARDAGPFALNVPANVFREDVVDPWPGRLAPAVSSAQRVRPDPVAVEEALRLLAAAQRPVVLAGRGAVLSEARGELVALAERTGAALATTLLARGFFGEHPSSLGLAGGFGDPASQELLRHADLVLAFGATLTRYTTDWGTLFEDATLIRVDNAPGTAPEMNTVTLPIWADARATAAELLGRLPDDTVRASWAATHVPEARTTAASAGSQALGLTAPPTPSESSGVQPRRAVELLDAFLPRERGLVVDVGNQMGVPVAHFPVSDPRDQVYPWDFGAIGLGLGAALGAALARPERPTVAFLGDGAFMLALADADVARRYPMRLLIVITEDGGFRSERGSYLARGLDETLADYDNPDLAEVGRALGYATYTARTPAELEHELARLAADDPTITRPTLVVLCVDRLLPNPELDRAFTNYRPY